MLQKPELSAGLMGCLPRKQTLPCLPNWFLLLDFSLWGPLKRYSGQPRSQGFSLLNWVGGRPNSKGKSPGNEVGILVLLPAFLWSTCPKGIRGGAVVRAFASHQCGLGSNPGPGITCGLSLLLVLSLLCEVFLRVGRFSPLLKSQHFLSPIRSGTLAHV